MTVTVLMPAYNHARWVAAAVESVLSQTHEDLRLVVVDDGSTDGTYDALAAFADDPRVTLLTHPGRVNRGLHATLRLAAGHVTGTHVALLASDDAWYPHRIEAALDALGGAGACYSAATVVDGDDDDTGVEWGMPPPSGDLFADLLVKNVVPAPTILMTADAFRRAEGFVGEEPFEDLDLMLRVSAVTEVVYVAEPLARYRRNDTGIAATVERAGRTLAAYASAVAHVAAWPSLPEHRREPARTAAVAWAAITGSGARLGRAETAFVRRILAAWDDDVPAEVRAQWRTSVLQRLLGR